MRRILSLIPIVMLLSLPSVVSAATAEPVTIQADRLIHLADEKKVVAEGEVTARRGEEQIRAGYAELLIPDGRLSLSGGVTVTRGGEVLTAERGTLSLPAGTGILEGAEARIRPQPAARQGRGGFPLVISAGRIEKLSERQWRIDGGSFTTCEGDHPPWSIAAERVDMTLEGYAWGKNVRFRVGDIPILWLPRFFFPVKTERQSGFLFPRVGHSTLRGVTYEQPLYLVLSPSADVTITPLIETRRAVGSGIEFRRLAAGGGREDLVGSIVFPREGPTPQGTATLRFLENPGGKIAARGDVGVVSDRTYLSRFGRENGEYNRDSIDSSASVELRGGRGLVAAGVATTRDLLPVPRETVQRLPFVSGSLLPLELGSLPLHGSVDAEYISFSRNGTDLRRATLEPSLSLVTGLGPARLVLDAGWRLTGYRASDGLERGEGRHRGDISLTLPLEREFSHLRHSLFPRIGIRSSGRRDQGSLPLLDLADADRGGDVFYTEIATALERHDTLPDGKGSVRDLARLRLSHLVRLSGDPLDPTRFTPPTSRVGEIRLEGTVTPVSPLSLELDTRYDPDRSRVTSFLGSMAVDLPALAQGTVGWYHLRGRSSYLEAGVTIPLSPFSVGYRLRRSLDGGDTLESVTRLDYRHQCWGVGVSWSERNGEREFMVTYSLAGVGSVGR